MGFEGTLQALAVMGFEGVEFAGDYGVYADNPAGLKALLADLGLQVAGAHVGSSELRGERLEASIAFHQTLGTPWLIVPYDSRADDADGMAEHPGQHC